MPPRELILVAETSEAAEQARALVDGCGVDVLRADRQRRDALLWNRTVLGEASAQLPEQFKSEHDDVDWTRPSALRNRIVHGYWSIDLGIIHAAASDDLPGYIKQLAAVLERLTAIGEPTNEAPPQT